jgi:Ca2+/Na+ antiporter
MTPVPSSCTFDAFTDNLCLSVIDHTIGGLFLETCIFIFAFAGLAFAAEHLCNSMETLCERWKIHEDVGGATFIAFGGAIPEITINCVSTLKSVAAKSAEEAAISDMGVGAILGSGMIAYLLIPAFSRLLTDKALLLRKRAIYRDALFYLLAVVVLGSALYGGIKIYHAPVLVSIYICYVLVLVFSDHIDFFWSRALGHPHLGPVHAKNDPSTVPLLPVNGAAELFESSVEPAEPTDEDSNVLKNCSFVVSPLKYMIDRTSPDCRLGMPREDFYMLTFFISMGWITLFSFLITVTIERWVSLLNLPGASALFGFVLVAVGAEIPDSVNAVTIARRGLGGMAISACLGSQVVNISLGLGMPWLIASLLGKTVPLSSSNWFIHEACFHVIVAILTVIVVVNLIGPWRESFQKSEITQWKALVLMVCYFGSIGYLAYSTSSHNKISLG